MVFFLIIDGPFLSGFRLMLAPYMKDAFAPIKLRSRILPQTESRARHSGYRALN